MARNFYECAKNGGKVVNRKTKDGKRIKICYDKEGGSHIKHNNRKKIKKNYVNNAKASVTSLQILVEHFNSKRY
jgi:hypothetical protein